MRDCGPKDLTVKRRRSGSVKSEGFLRAARAAYMATRFAFWRRVDEDALAEKHAQPGLLSDFILGSQDGLVNVLGVTLGLAIASWNLTDPLTIILAGGLAATFAESISMGAVAYTTTLARRDHYQAEVEREKEEMRELPDLERQEVRQILERWDFHGEELEEMLEKIVSKPKAWLEIMMAHELNLAPVDEGQARKSAVLVGIAAIIGSLIPLVPFLVIGANLLLGIAVSLVVSGITLFGIGWWKAKTTVGHPIRSGTQMLIIGITSALAGFGIAWLVSGGRVF
jgi:VIT1/CCC1 family predicted Fe2+/Mn2+ transporter